MKLPDAARELGVKPDTVRLWLRRGAPCVRPGRCGPGGAALVDVAAVRAWRGGGAAIAPQPLPVLDLHAVGRALGATWRDADDLGISGRQRAALLLVTFEALVLALTGRPPVEPSPPEVLRLLAIALGG